MVSPAPAAPVVEELKAPNPPVQKRINHRSSAQTADGVKWIAEWVLANMDREAKLQLAKAIGYGTYPDGSAAPEAKVLYNINYFLK